MKKFGMSLVEILIAVVIFVSAIIPIWGLMSSSHQQVVRSADEIKISQITVEILEQIENYANAETLLEKLNESDGPDGPNPLTSDCIISLRDVEGLKIKVGSFDYYLMPELTVMFTPITNKNNNPIGVMVSLTVSYKSKESMDRTEYMLRGFLSAKK